jgi:hypothetical protein
MQTQDRQKDVHRYRDITPRQIHTWLKIHRHVYTDRQTHIHGYRHTEPLTQTKTNTDTCRHIEKHLCTDLHIQKQTAPLSLSLSLSSSHMRASTHTHTHTHTHDLLIIRV